MFCLVILYVKGVIIGSVFIKMFSKKGVSGIFEFIKSIRSF